MTADNARSRVGRTRRRGEDVLPAPLARRVAPFALECGRQENFAKAFRKIALVERADAVKMRVQSGARTAWKQRYSILGALAVAHDDFLALEVDVFDPQAHAFHDPKAS